MHRYLFIVLLNLFSIHCASYVPVYPSRPEQIASAPLADPAPSKWVLHVALHRNAIQQALEEAIPLDGEGAVTILRGERSYHWHRESVTVEFKNNQMLATIPLHTELDLPISSIQFRLAVSASFEPLLTYDYQFKLQSIDVKVTSTDTRLKIADEIGGVFEKIKTAIESKLSQLSYDARLPLEEIHANIAAPLSLPLGQAQGCLLIKVLSVELGPTVYADGIEKDIALVVAPSITMPCVAHGPPSLLPSLANVAALPSGPFVTQVAIATSYDELAKAMELAFTNGKYYFSKEHPGLYLSTPEVFASGDKLVVKLQIHGPIKKFGIETTINGDLYLTGHPTVIDNELMIPDLEPTIDTANFLLNLKTTLDGNALKEQARNALRLDLAPKLNTLRSKLSSDLSFGDEHGCLQTKLHKIEIGSARAHGSYLRLDVSLTAQASAYLPCPDRM